MKCIIVDDEPLALDLLTKYVAQTPFIELVARCSSGVEALAAIERGGVELAFLDIQMPDLNGLELSRLVGDRCAVIFTTAFEQYALDGFRVNALDYLLKPFGYADFLKAAQKGQQWLDMRAAYQGDRQEPEPDKPRNIVVKADYKQQVIALDSITYIEGIRDYIKIHTDGEGAVQTLLTLKAVTEMLPQEQFVRVHRSFIVNIDKVKTIERGAIVFGKQRIPVSDSYKESFQQLFNSKTISQ